MKSVVTAVLAASFATVAIALMVAARADSAAPEAAAGTSRPAFATQVDFGKHLVTTAGCHDCHTPLMMGKEGPEPDYSRALSGHPESLVMPTPPAPVGPWIVSAAATNTAWSGPWGVSFTANLTPDKETGLGAWTEQNFLETIRSGRHLGRGRQILPPMPIPMYSKFSDDELKAIFAYLRTIPAVKNRVPVPLPPAGS